MSHAYSLYKSASKGDEETRTYQSRQPDVEADSSEESDRSSEHVPGHRSIRVTVYGLKQESEIVRIWIDGKSTYGDILEGLAHLHDVQAITVLQAVYGRKPYWIESKSKSTIEPTCVHLYAVIVTEPQRYILGVVRTALSDYPIALFDSINSPAMAVSQKIIRAQPNLTHRIKTITGYSNKRDMSDDEYNYELLRDAEESNFPTVFFITVDEAPGPFMVNASDNSIPPFLQIQFAQCNDLLQRAYNLELLPLQAIHVSRAIHHLVISLAKALGGGLRERDSLVSDDLTKKDNLGDLLRVAPVIASNLQSILHAFGVAVKALEEKSVDPKALMVDIRSILSTLCGDYHGAVVVRHSFEAFERLVRMDLDEIPLSAGNGDNVGPVISGPTGEIGHSKPGEGTRTLFDEEIIPDSDKKDYITWRSDQPASLADDKAVTDPSETLDPMSGIPDMYHLLDLVHEIGPSGPGTDAYRSSLRGTSPVPGPGRSSNLPSAPPGQIRSRSPNRGPARTQRPTQAPSPLSLPGINNPSSSASMSLPSTQQNGGNPDNSKAGLGSLKKKGLRQVASSGGLRLGGGGQNERLRTPPEQSSRTSSDKRGMSPRKLSPPRRSISHSMAQATSFDDGERSELSTPSLIPPGGGSSSSSTPMARSASLRSKLSISALRSKGSNPRPSRDGNDAPFSNLPLVNSGQGNEEEERVQIKDMEFELVKPILKTSGLRGSEDAGSQVGSPAETESIRSGLESQGSAWRADSPSTSPATSYVRSPNVHNSVDSLANFRNAGAIQIAAIEAHRLREQKWMTLISTVPSARARKSGKIKKLLLEGVPSSVRGRVWGHITDSKARRVEGLFEQLVKKAPQGLIPIVEQDVERCFPDHPHLQDPRGSLANLLLAYTAMVPDIRYRNGLTRIAGHLLLQAPDEDAFWVFVALMDSHLRGYYHATNTAQFEIDASLFQSLVESGEPELAQVLFNDIGLRAVDICGTWFSCLFAGVLPPDHLYRIWDVLLYEGPIYLFRVALVLIMLCKRPLMTMNLVQAGRGPIIELFSRPPSSAIPQDPESFISHTFTVKVRDDDLRKQRLKREVQWEKDRLAQR